MQKVKNQDTLLSHGCQESRRIILEIAEKTLRRLDAGNRIRSIMRLEGDILTVGTKSWDLSKKRNVYLVGAGKAANHMAMAVDSILGDRLTKGIVIVKIAEETDHYLHTEIRVGGHPLPNEEGLRASRDILRLVNEAGPEDLFIAVMSGGSSALMSCPIKGISLEDEIKTTDVLLKSGAGIAEINAVRRHISSMNGGMLAKRISERGAELIGFSISDAVGREPTNDIGVPDRHFRATPIGPDNTTLEDARNVIKNYALEGHLPESVINHLMNAGPECETPKEFPNNTYYLLNTLPDSVIYAKEEAEKMGITAHILTSFLEGESKDAGTMFAGIAREIQARGNPFPAPCVILAAGETVTTIPEKMVLHGHGGPGQELTLSFAITAEKAPGAALLSIDSEGTDGTSMMAGGLTDSMSLANAKNAGIDVFRALREHSCYEALNSMGDTVFTGNTGTNLCDLNIMFVPRAGDQNG